MSAGSAQTDGLPAGPTGTACVQPIESRGGDDAAVSGRPPAQDRVPADCPRPGGGCATERPQNGGRAALRCAAQPHDDVTRSQQADRVVQAAFRSTASRQNILQVSEGASA